MAMFHDDNPALPDEPDNDVDESLDTAMGRSEVMAEARPAANAAPAFQDEDPDTTGTQNSEAVREIDENAKGASLSDAVRATDADEDDDSVLIYRISGADADNFTINNSGQITLKSDLELDYEAQPIHRVTVTATDPSGASSSISVVINVVDKDDPAAIQLNVAPVFADDSADLSVAENSEAGSAVGDPVTATDTNAGDSLTLRPERRRRWLLQHRQFRPDLRRCRHCPGLRERDHQLHSDGHRHRPGRLQVTP